MKANRETLFPRAVSKPICGTFAGHGIGDGGQCGFFLSAGLSPTFRFFSLNFACQRGRSFL